MSLTSYNTEIVSYLDLLQMVHVVKEQIRPRIAAARMRRKNEAAASAKAGVAAAVTETGQHVARESYPLLTMSAVKTLAHNTFR